MGKKLSEKDLTKSVLDSYLNGRKEHFRGVIWPREPMIGPKGQVYRYPIVGMVVSDQPIEMFEGKNEIVLDGSVSGICDILEITTQGKASHKIGDANNVLTCLDFLVEK